MTPVVSIHNSLWKYNQTSYLSKDNTGLQRWDTMKHKDSVTVLFLAVSFVSIFSDNFFTFTLCPPYIFQSRLFYFGFNASEGGLLITFTLHHIVDVKKKNDVTRAKLTERQDPTPRVVSKFLNVALCSGCFTNSERRWQHDNQPSFWCGYVHVRPLVHPGRTGGWEGLPGAPMLDENLPK